MVTTSPVRNLDERAQNIQLRAGLVFLMAGLAASVAMHRAGASASAHLLLMPLFLGGIYGIAAALTHVCAVSALTGQRLTETGREPIANRLELRSVRKRGLVVMSVSVAVSAAADLLLMLVH